jgi:hypothetical protein
VRFLSFATELDRFLSQVSDTPLIQSAFWHQHGYWFELIGGKVLGVLTAGIEALRHYAAVPAEEDLKDTDYGAAEAAEDAARAQHEMDAAIRSLQRLTSSIYRYPLDRYAYKRGALDPGARPESTAATPSEHAEHWSARIADPREKREDDPPEAQMIGRL